LDLLGLRGDRKVSRAEVSRAYRDSMKRWHPDLPGGSLERATAINEAYERIMESVVVDVDDVVVVVVDDDDGQRPMEGGGAEEVDVVGDLDPLAAGGGGGNGTEEDAPVDAKAAKPRVSFMQIAASPTLARAAMVQSAGFAEDEGLVSAIASDPKEDYSGDVLGAVAAAVQRESKVDNVVARRMLERALLVRKTLEKCSKFLKDAARARYQCTLSATMASRSMLDYIARLNQQSQHQDDFEGANKGAESAGNGGGSRSGFSEVGHTFVRRLEQVIVPPPCIEEDPKCRQQLVAAHKLLELSRAIHSVVKDLESHNKTSPSASEILKLKDSAVTLGGLRDPWLAECEYNVLLRQALLANRERRGLLERMTELVEQKQVSVLHNAISAAEATVLREDQYFTKFDADWDKLALHEGERSSSVSETNQAGNSVDLLLEQRLVECAGGLFDDKRGDLIKVGVLEIQLATSTSSRSESGGGSASAWQTVRGCVTRSGNFCWFSGLIPTPNGLDGVLVPDAVINLKSLSVEPEEAPNFDLVESGSWGRTKRRYKFRAMNVEDSVDWILLFKEGHQSRS